MRAKENKIVVNNYTIIFNNYMVAVVIRSVVRVCLTGAGKAGEGGVH